MSEPYRSSPNITGYPWTSEFKLVIKDEPTFPSSIFPAIILHESVHMWQILNNYQPDEMQAYTLNWLLHLLHRDGTDVFTGQPYIGAANLLKLAS